MLDPDPTLLINILAPETRPMQTITAPAFLAPIALIDLQASRRDRQFAPVEVRAQAAEARLDGPDAGGVIEILHPTLGRITITQTTVTIQSHSIKSVDCSLDGQLAAVVRSQARVEVRVLD